MTTDGKTPITDMFLLNHDDASLDLLGNEVLNTLIFDESFSYIDLSYTGLQQRDAQNQRIK